ncbi:hypothetical protein BC830DRAFT_1165254 [Chytriomyces sp. MP71]|nr:hypothetical protein BC830DRAFT_1165254 [Chytriomyces sp. MP71]
MATVLSRLVTPAVLSHLPSGSEAVASKLSETGVCGVCIVRILGVRKPSLFCTLSVASSSIPAASPTVLQPASGSSSAKLDAFDVSDGITSTSSSPPIQECPACLGLLSNRSIHATVECAKAHSLKENVRGLTSFHVSVRVPTQLALRARLVGLEAARVLGTETPAFGQVALRDPKRFDIKDPEK